MKKFLLAGIVATLLTVGASAQSRKYDDNKGRPGIERKKESPGMDYRTHDLTRGERGRMRHNSVDYNRAKHRAYRDGKLSHRERKQLHKMKKHNRHHAYRYKHNDRRRS